MGVVLFDYSHHHFKHPIPVSLWKNLQRDWYSIISFEN